MCTATWWRGFSGYGLLFNRDEQRVRAEAEPPKERVEQGVRYLAPLDPEGGGTWVGGNEYGLVIALLNHFPAEAPATPEHRSRGLLVRELMACKSVASVDAVLARGQLHCYRPCFLLAMDGSRQQQWMWDGASLETRVPEMPLTTSSYASAEVVNARRVDFQQRFGKHETPGSDALRRFHLTHHEGHGAESVLMAREDAATRSFTEVEVGQGRLSLYYHRVHARRVPVLAQPVDQHLDLLS